MECGKLGPGVWSAVLPPSALWSYYKYRVHVYSPQTTSMQVGGAAHGHCKFWAWSDAICWSAVGENGQGFR